MKDMQECLDGEIDTRRRLESQISELNNRLQDMRDTEATRERERMAKLEDQLKNLTASDDQVRTRDLFPTYEKVMASFLERWRGKLDRRTGGLRDEYRSAECLDQEIERGKVTNCIY